MTPDGATFRNLTKAEFDEGYPFCSCAGYSEMPHIHTLPPEES